MPTVLRFKGYRFFFFALDRGEPPHIHVEKDDALAKFWLHRVEIAYVDGFSGHEITFLIKFIVKHRNVFIGRWNAFFEEK